MIRTSVWCLVGLLSLATAVPSQAQQTSGSVEKTIGTLENQWLQAQRTNNPDLVAPILADKFVYTDGEGKLDSKAAMLADAKTVKWDSVDYKNVQITVYGDTAIATGEFVGKGTDSSGKPVNDRSRYTDTWTKMPDGKWQCVASQDTPIKM
jgi:ketosteroid isomerase-like protein